MRLFSRIFLLFSIVYALGVVAYISGSELQSAKAATNNSNVVISQVQIEGASLNDEFVELYNPTNSTINLAGWRLGKKTSTATPSATAEILVSSMSGTITSRKYFLITSDESLSSPSADLLYSNGSNHLANDNAVLLYSDNGHTVVDKVGFGTTADFETADFPTNPTAGQSIIRKAFANSTAFTLGLGGSESLFGNGFDTD